MALGRIIRKIGRGVGTTIGTIVGGATGIPGGASLGGTVGGFLGGGFTPGPRQGGSPNPPKLVPIGSGPGTSFLPGGPNLGGGLPPLPGGPSLPPPPPSGGGPTRPMAPGPSNPNAQLTAGAAIVGRVLSSPMVRRVAGLLRDFMTGLGAVITLDAATEILNSPYEALDANTLGYLQQFNQWPPFAQFKQSMNDDGYGGPAVLPATKMEQYNPPSGYVTVTVPGTGETVYMLKRIAQARGLWKAPAKPPISVREWKSAKAFGRVQKKLEKLNKPFKPKIKTVYSERKGARC